MGGGICSVVVQGSIVGGVQWVDYIVIGIGRLGNTINEIFNSIPQILFFVLNLLKFQQKQNYNFN